MEQLITQFVLDYYNENGDCIDHPTYQVGINDGKNDWVLSGFVRRQDAEIARQFLITLDMDWSLPSDLFWARMAELGFPDRKSLMNEACKRLQW